MALTADRNLNMLTGPTGPQWSAPVAAGFRIWRGSIVAVCLDGTIVPAAAANTPSAQKAILGLASHLQDNTGANSMLVGSFIGAGNVRVLRGTWGLPFDVAPTWAAYLQPVYAIDDQTVSLTQTPQGGTPRLQVGLFAGLQADGTPYVTI